MVRIDMIILLFFNNTYRKFNLQYFGSVFNAVKCNLTELHVATKSACISLIVGSVDTYAHVLQFHMLIDGSVANVQEVFSDVFVLWQFIAQAVPLPPAFPSLFPVPLTGWELTAGFPGFASHL